MKTHHPQTLARLRQAAMTGTSLRHIKDMTGLDTEGLNNAARQLQQADGQPEPLLDWDAYARQQRALYRQAAKNRRLNNAAN